MNSILESIDWNKLFAALYDDHTCYLDTDPFKTNPQKSKVRSPKNKSHSTQEPCQNLTKLQISKSVNNLSQHEFEKENNAAKKIQRCWRSYRNKYIYSNLKDMIDKYSKMEPSMALRPENPREASLLDTTSGARVHSVLPKNWKTLSNTSCEKEMHLDFKKTDHNDWRVYERKHDQLKSPKKISQPNKSVKRKPKSNSKHLEMSWIKTQYGI